MTSTEQILTILIASAGTLFMRFLPFIIFPADKPTPKYVQYLGRVLPGAIFAMLVVYSLKDITPTAYPFGLPEIIACAVTAALHLWKKQMILSMAAGTLVYIILIQFVFV